MCLTPKTSGLRLELRARKALERSLCWVARWSIYSKQIIELAVKHRLPAMYYTADWVEAGGLMTYGTKPHRLGPARRYVCGQDFERH